MLCEVMRSESPSLGLLLKFGHERRRRGESCCCCYYGWPSTAQQGSDGTEGKYYLGACKGRADDDDGADDDAMEQPAIEIH